MSEQKLNELAQYINPLEGIVAERTMIINALCKNDLMYFTDKSEKWLDKLP